jgi:hypothetical protein
VNFPLFVDARSPTARPQNIERGVDNDLFVEGLEKMEEKARMEDFTAKPIPLPNPRTNNLAR